jgi:probable HAF family extracellular repeat protein
MKTLAFNKSPLLVLGALVLNVVVSGPAAAQKVARRVPMYRVTDLGTPQDKATEPRVSDNKRRRIAALKVPNTITITVPNVNTGAMESVPAHPQITDINDKGQAVGSLLYTPPSTGATPDRAAALLWQNGKPNLLTGLGHQIEGASDINNRGQIVGYSQGSTEGLAWLWKDGKTYDLNHRIPAGSGWILRKATAINERGQIMGTGTSRGKPRAFLLTPK